MKNTIHPIAFLALLFVIGMFSSCTSSKKFDFANAYKFRTIKHQPKSEILENEQSETSLNSTAQVLDINRELTDAENLLLEKTGLIGSNEVITPEELKTRVESLNKKEKKELRKELIKEVKSEMKQLKTIEKSEYTSVAAASDVDLTGYTRIGVITGGLGIIVLILGALFGVGALTVAGAILIIGGVVFILIDVLQ